MVTLVNRAKMSTSTTGTGTITLGSAETGYQSFADAGVADGDVVRYVIEDGDNWEIGSGTYTSTGTTLTRTVDESSNSDAALNLTGSAVVFITAAAGDVFQGELFAENPSSATAPTATGTNAVAIGSNAQSDGNQSVAIGVNAVSGLRGVSIGQQAGNSTASGGDYNVSVGFNSAYYLTTGDNNVAVGRNALQSSNLDKLTGSSNVGVGYLAGSKNTSGSFNTFLGNNAGNSVTTGSNNVSIGYDSDCSANTSSQTAVGYSAQAAGSRATALTYSYASGADSFAAAIANNTSSYGATGTQSIAIGLQARATALGSSAFGYGAVSTHAGSSAIGTLSSTTANGQVSIGNSSYHVRISDAYNLPTSDGTNGQVLTTDGSGAVTFADAGGGGADLYAANESSPLAQPSATGTNAVAIGEATKSTGTSSIALGVSIASGTDSFAAAMGSNSSSYGASGTSSTALGYQAKASQSYAFATGYQAVASGNSAIAMGFSADATGSQSIAIGYTSLASATESIAIGDAESTGNQSIAIGDTAVSSSIASVAIGQGAQANERRAFSLGFRTSSHGIRGKYSYSGASLSGNNDGASQQGKYVLVRVTTDATATEITTDNAAASTNNQVILSNNSAYAFHGTIVAREQAADGTDCAAWRVEGLIRREGSASTTTLVNSATTVLDNTPSWGMALSADTTNGCLKIQVTGAASTDIRWVATIHTSEVIYA